MNIQSSFQNKMISAFFKCTAISLALLLTTAPVLYSQKTTAYNQLVDVNIEWRNQADVDPILKNTHATELNEQQLIQFHLQQTEKLLRSRSTAQLTPLQKKNRETNLNVLHAYWQNGVFPKNTGHPGRRPYFIDVFNTYCAVGYLMKQSGADAMARDINRAQNYSYLRDIKHPDLMNWANNSGLTIDELALIQPGYSCYPTSIVEIHYDNAGADVNEYIEVVQAPDILPPAVLYRIDFFDHNDILYKSILASSLSTYSVSAIAQHSLVDYVFGYYQFPANESLADSGTIRLKYNLGGGNIGDISVFQYNSSGITVTQPIESGSNPWGGSRHHSIFEDGNGVAGTTLNICGGCQAVTRNAFILPATYGAVNYVCHAILPLTLSSFNYTLINNTVRLNWQSASESNTDKFEIEKSTDGVNFNKIGTVASAGTSNTAKDYYFPDANPAAINYYRIKQIDKDGKESYSKTLSVKFKAGNPFSIQPTIVTDQLRINISLQQQDINAVQVYDLSGRAILNFRGVSGYNEINVSNLSAGSYLMRLQTTDGRTYSQRFVKQ